MEEVPGSEKFFPAQLVFLALGFLGPQNEVLHALGVKQDARSNIQTPSKVRIGISSISFHLTLTFFTEIFDQCGRYFRCWRLSSWSILDCLGHQVRLICPERVFIVTKNMFTVRVVVQPPRSIAGFLLAPPDCLPPVVSKRGYVTIV